MLKTLSLTWPTCAVLVSLIFLAAIFFSSSPASAYERPDTQPAIVLAAFGTTEVGALKSILNIRDKVKSAFPTYEVRLAFTSNIIRSIWHKRAKDDEFKKQNPNVPADIYEVKNALSVLADLQEDGARLILVQSLHITDGEEYKDLDNLVKALASYQTVKPILKPFPWIGVGEPGLGLNDGDPKEIEKAVKALSQLAHKAKSSQAALVLMGHGNEHLTQQVFSRLEQALQKAYGPDIYVGTVEAAPGAPEILEKIKKSAKAPKKALLAPLMIVAGDHALNDMAGDEPDSWASTLKNGGLEVETFLEGLGSNDSWVEIYVEHLKALAPKVEAQKAKDK
ncbi:MAG: sirohydrochlorin cobaltochelatase [Deltaproteobacteria bacterium]|nr:sirohydrochlorin cobaltochelatase [Deltaproteobacteria bacterium]